MFKMPLTEFLGSEFTDFEVAAQAHFKIFCCLLADSRQAFSVTPHYLVLFPPK